MVTPEQESLADARVRRELMRDGLREMLKTPASRAAFWLLYNQSQVFSVAPAMDHGTLAFTEGRRSWALQVFNLATELVPDLYGLAKTEYEARMRAELSKLETEG